MGLQVNVLISLIYAAYFFAVAAILFPLALLLAIISPLVDPGKRLLNRLTAAYMYRVLTISPRWKFEFGGLEHLKGRGPFILVVNHQSFADIVVLSALPLHFRWVSKQSIFQVPILGWIMSLNGHVAIHRGEIASTRKMMRTCARLLAQGTSLIMFPEGTRSPDGEVGHFKDGPFRLAKQTGTLVVPVAVHGTRNILKKGSCRMGWQATAYIDVLPPIAVSDCDFDAGALRDYACASIKQQLAVRRGASVKASEPVVAHPYPEAV